MKLILICFAIFILISHDDSKAQTFTSSNLPIVIINTYGQTIPNEPKITADMGIIFNGEGVRNNVTDPHNNYKGKIGIEIRGESSTMYPKKQYGIETRDVFGEDSSVSLLGFPKEADWILYGPYSDKTLIRDVLAYQLANEMGSYATRSKFCEVILNGEYWGVYVLLEKIKRDKNRVDISKLDPTTTSGDSLTGGYILKIDKSDNSEYEWFSPYPPFLGATQKIRYVHEYPKPEDITDVQHNYIKSYIYAFENLMHGPYFSDTTIGYPKYINVDSFVDYFIHNEVMKNVDAYRLSAFLHKDRESKGGKLTMGPVWDYNISLGNGDYHDVWKTDGWHIDFLTTNSSFISDPFQMPFWWRNLYNDANFRNKVRARWEELKQTVFNKDKIFSQIDSCVTLLNEASARNYQKWPVLSSYVWPNYYIGGTYTNEINYLKNFISARLTWISANIIGQLTEVYKTENLPVIFELQQNYPNPFNPSTTIKYQIPENGFVTLKIYDILGKEMATLVNEEKKTGGYEVNFNASEMASGVYIYKLLVNDIILSKKMVLMK